jgi:hypothetical protein
MKTRLPQRLFAAMLLLNLGGVPFAHAAATQPVSMQQVVAEPQRFDGQRIRVSGFLRLEFDRNALYLSRNDFNESVAAHALRLELSNSQLRSLGKLNNGRVSVEGTFAAKKGGPWAGSLHRVAEIRMARKPGKR